MSKSRVRRPTPPPSPRYTKRHGIGRDRTRWPAGLGTFVKANFSRTPTVEAPTDDHDHD